MVQLVQTMLGLYPFAPAHVLALVRPRLPEWLPAVTVRNESWNGALAPMPCPSKSSQYAHDGPGSLQKPSRGKVGPPTPAVPLLPQPAVELEEVMYLTSGEPVQWSSDVFAPDGIDLHVRRALEAGAPAPVRLAG